MRDVILHMSMSLDGFVGSDREHLPQARRLDLVGATPFPSGGVVHIYRPQHS